MITGAGSGIGAETARRMAAEGASVVLGDLNERSLQRVAEETGGVAVPVNVTVESEVQALIETALSRYGRLDILHNNAVTPSPDDSDAVGTSNEAWQSMFDLIVMAAAYGCRVAIPAMRETGGGSIINTSSVAAHTAGGRIAYGSCKAALETFTLHTAATFGRDGVRCNAVAPGPVRTEGIGRLFSEDALDQMGLHVAMGRIAVPRDIAEVVVFLASDASSFVSGQVITVNGGGPSGVRW